MFFHLKCLLGQHNIFTGNLLAASKPCVSESTMYIVKKKENRFRGSINPLALEMDI